MERKIEKEKVRKARSRQRPMNPKTDRITTGKSNKHKEIEKKFLIRENGSNYPSKALLRMYPSVKALIADVKRNGKPIRQGYLSIEMGKDIANRLGVQVDFSPKEARIREKSGSFFFTMKGDGGLTRDELPETEISPELFGSYWPFTKGHRVEKIRLARRYKGFTVEIDVYTDRDLIVAEIEFLSEKEAERVSPLGKDVTEEKKYKNKNLAR